MMDDAEEAIVIIGSSAGTAKEAIRELRAQGKKVGLIKGAVDGSQETRFNLSNT